jgi:class 3 adenylate cyclase/tetratricopeptide (TPR) repeat protein
MTTERTRRLAAVWFADIVGYTALSSRDEDGALHAVDELQRIATATVEGGDGRIVKFIGDAVMAVFDSTTGAISAGLALQEGFEGSELLSDCGVALRVGVHLGEISEAADGDVYGDGVNVASRIEGAAAPGQVVVSEAVYQQVKKRPAFGTEPLGPHALKGLDEPIALYLVWDAEKGRPSSFPAAAALSEHYTIERELGAGGMATVYLATDRKHSRQVAVKVLRPELAASVGVERFLREIRIAATLQHPHILPLHDSGEADGLLYYVMPFVEGESVGNLLRRDGPLPVPFAIRLLREISDALAYAHAEGVVHRDIKPDNVMVSSQHALLMDFGVAKLVMGSGDGSDPTGTSVLLGTPAYMAPEQISGESELDHRTDIYALGVLAYQMLVGEAPFARSSPQAVMAAHLTVAPPSVSSRRSIPSALDHWVARCLAKSPEERWQSATEAVQHLDDLISAGDTAQQIGPSTVAGTSSVDGAGVRTGETPTSKGPLSLGRFTRLAAAAVTLLAVAAVAIVFLSRGNSGPLGVSSAMANEAAAGLAVVPFTVQGEDVEIWREGLVDLFATNMDGVGGFRTIDTRTVLARWNEAVDADVAPDLETVLGVARATGARFAMEGSVTSLGGVLSLSATVHDLDTGESFPIPRTNGDPQDILTLVDSLSVAVMSRILELEGRALPPMQSAASLTTSSPAALNDYLRGEAHLRRAEFKEARDAFQAAVDGDGEFAMAYVRLSIVEGWMAEADENDNLGRAIELIDRLPAREQILVRGYNGFIEGLEGAIDEVESAVRRYPDDPELRELLGEFYVHAPYVDLLDPSRLGPILEGLPALDPGFGPAYIHLIEYYMAAADSAATADAVDRYMSVSDPTTDGAWVIRARAALLFNDDAASQTLRDAVDTLPDDLYFGLQERNIGGSPAGFAHWERIEAALGGASAFGTARGKAQDVASLLEDVGFPEVAWSLAITGPGLFGEGRLDSIMAAEVDDDCFLCMGQALYRVARSPGEATGALPPHLVASLEELRSEDLSVAADALEEVFVAFSQWKSDSDGGAAAALRVFERLRLEAGSEAKDQLGGIPTLFAAEIHREAGRPLDALAYYRPLTRDLDPVISIYATMRRAELLEDLGEDQAALKAWTTFLEAWTDADEDLPLLQKARDSVARLGT